VFVQYNAPSLIRSSLQQCIILCFTIVIVSVLYVHNIIITRKYIHMHRHIILRIKRLNFFFAPRLLVYTHQAHKKIGTVIIIQELYSVYTPLQQLLQRPVYSTLYLKTPPHQKQKKIYIYI